MRRLATSVVVVLSVVALWRPAPAVAQDDVSYRPPADVVYRPPVEDAPIVDPFRPPPEPWAAGNRGIDYGTEAGAVVRASAAGEVVFAGPVAGTLHVVVLHDDGIRTSYSFLADVTVRRGDRVAAGDQVGVAGGPLHFGARVGDAYLDPLQLLGGTGAVHLVPDDARRPQSEARERGALERFVRALGGRAAGVGATALGWARDGAVAGARLARDQAIAQVKAQLAEVGDTVSELRGWARYANNTAWFFNGGLTAAVADALDQWRAAQRTCTRPDVAPPRLTERHLAVLVGGLGSSSGHASVLDVDTAALGYAPGDVMQFSYRGGTTADNSYGPADTQVDIRESGRRLRALLERLRQEHPGVTVDVIAHSQGGLVTRSALGEWSRIDSRLPPIGAVVTLGTPHHGTNLATAGGMVAHTGPGHDALEAWSDAGLTDIDPRSTSVRQMDENSRYIHDLNARPLPSGLRYTSIAARGDIVVPAPRAHLDGATNVTVTVDGVAHDHDALPGSHVAQRELALAVAGRAPTCESAKDAVLDVLVPRLVSQAEDGAGAVLTIGGHRLERTTKLDLTRKD